MRADIIIYSYNRAAQLDLLLRSIKDHLEDPGMVYVIYKADRGYVGAYEKVVSHDYGLRAVYASETNFKEQVAWVLSSMDADFVLGLCDDDVFIRNTSISSALVTLWMNAEIHALSLKHNRNMLSKVSFLRTDDGMIHWDWTKEDCNTDLGYCCCINTYVYRTAFLRKLVPTLEFTSPPTFEGAMHDLYNRRMKRNIPSQLFSFEETSVLNIPMNRVQTISDNAVNARHRYTTEWMNEQFLSGKRISTEGIYNYPNQFVQADVEVTLEDR